MYSMCPSPAYIAGVTNPIFESSGTWDLLCDVGSGRVVVHKDIHLNYPPNQYQPTSGFGLNSPPLIVRSGTLKAEGSAGNEDEMLKGAARDGGGERKGDFLKDGTDNLFVEDVSSFLSVLKMSADVERQRSYLLSTTTLVRTLSVRDSQSTRLDS